jgi:hypothetical protein
VGKCGGKPSAALEALLTQDTKRHRVGVRRADAGFRIGIAASGWASPKSEQGGSAAGSAANAGVLPLLTPAKGSRMATFEDLRKVALAMPHVAEKAHFERTAFKAKRIFISGRPDFPSANLLLSIDRQTFWCNEHSDVFHVLPNKWGLQGWTALLLPSLSQDVLIAALRDAWTRGLE